MKIKLQELLIKPGDKVLVRVNVPLNDGLGYVHDKDYPGVVTHHGAMTHIDFVGDDGKTHTEVVEYSSFNGGMCTCTLQIEPEELANRQQRIIQESIEKAEARFAQEIAKIKIMFD